MGKVLFLKNLTHTNIIEAPETGPELLSDATVTALANKGVTAQAGVSTTDNLPDLINSIKLGTDVKIATGTVSVKSGQGTVNCGFKPDILLFYINNFSTSSANYESIISMPFAIAANSDIEALSNCVYINSSYDMLEVWPKSLTDTGATCYFYLYTSSNPDGTYLTNSAYNYTAIKYT